MPTRRGSGSSPARCRRPAGCSRRARRSSSTRTTPTARATRTAATRTTSSTGTVPFAHARAQPAAVVRDPPGVHRRRQGRRRERRRRRSTTRSAQRADFFEEEVGLETTLKRPIVNTRDEPHADPQKYRRLHVIVGDANLCEVATFLKVGTTAIVLAMIEDDFIDKDLVDRRPGAAMRTVSHDPTCRATRRARRRRRVHRDRAAVGVPAPRAEVRRRDRARGVRRRRRRRRGARPLGSGRSPRSSATRWRSTASSTGSRSWTLLEAYVDRDGLEWDDPKLALLDLQYHDVRPERSLYERLVRAGKVERLVDEADVIDAMTEPPATHPGLLPGHAASPAGPTPWSPPTGTAWSSTSAPTRCGGSR